ncbi:copper-binding protein [Undibacterium sp.]|uniref:copper-binding protein n=1 Tax=Undibacterium sp. TaxID=1914977 RepID=UPI00272F1C10|nr:copper-binding protein [Undibacterium sp.]MDP1980697.1 copper-binding protein [Undibacterium sp.]
MKLIKTLAMTIFLGMGLQMAHAQETNLASPESKVPASASHDASEAEVIKIDQSANKITLKHGPIKNLDMPAMSMVFRVKDTAMLAKLAVGDKVRFRAEKVNGAIYVTDIQAVQ